MINAFNISERKTAWWIILLEGIVALIVGFLLLFSPVRAVTTIALFIGWYLLIVGLMTLFDAFMYPVARSWKIFSGIMGLLAGFILIHNPLWAALLVPSVAILYLAIIGLIHGITQVIAAFRGNGHGALAFGLVSIIFSLVLFFGFPLFVLALPFVLGICGIIGGILTATIAIRMRLQHNKAAQPSW